MYFHPRKHADFLFDVKIKRSADFYQLKYKKPFEMYANRKFYKFFFSYYLSLFKITFNLSDCIKTKINKDHRRIFNRFNKISFV